MHILKFHTTFSQPSCCTIPYNYLIPPDVGRCNRNDIEGGITIGKEGVCRWEALFCGCQDVGPSHRCVFLPVSFCHQFLLPIFSENIMTSLYEAGGERPSYTKRILDILESIRKQREETDKVQIWPKFKVKIVEFFYGQGHIYIHTNAWKFHLNWPSPKILIRQCLSYFLPTNRIQFEREMKNSTNPGTNGAISLAHSSLDWINAVWLHPPEMMRCTGRVEIFRNLSCDFNYLWPSHMGDEQATWLAAAIALRSLMLDKCCVNGIQYL